jgi:hypothetical protein
MSAGHKLVDLLRGVMTSVGFEPDFTWQCSRDLLGLADLWFPVVLLAKGVLLYITLAVILSRVRWLLGLLGRRA